MEVQVTVLQEYQWTAAFPSLLCLCRVTSTSREQQSVFSDWSRSMNGKKIAGFDCNVKGNITWYIFCFRNCKLNKVFTLFLFFLKSGFYLPTDFWPRLQQAPYGHMTTQHRHIQSEPRIHSNFVPMFTLYKPAGLCHRSCGEQVWLASNR